MAVPTAVSKPPAAAARAGPRRLGAHRPARRGARRPDGRTHAPSPRSPHFGAPDRDNGAGTVPKRPNGLSKHPARADARPRPKQAPRAGQRFFIVLPSFAPFFHRFFHPFCGVFPGPAASRQFVALGLRPCAPALPKTWPPLRPRWVAHPRPWPTWCGGLRGIPFLKTDLASASVPTWVPGI
jgi:hypothetical protein